jgi:hypothetical protein
MCFQSGREGPTIMNRFESLGVAGWAWRGAAALSSRPAIWLPFLLVVCVQAAVLLLLMSFHHRALLPFGLPLVKLLGGEGATHYPTFYYALPMMFFRSNLAISVFVASITGGVATLLFAEAFGFSGKHQAWKRALRCAPTLVAVDLLLVGLGLGIGALAALIPQEITLHSSVGRWGTRAATMVMFILLQSFMAYTTAWIVLMGHGIWPAIRDSVRVTLRTFAPTVIVLGIPAVLLFPFSYASSRMDLVAGKLNPEVVVGLLGAQVVCQILVAILLVAAVTRLFLWRVEANR